MYGMVNKAMEELVCQQFGEPTWQRVLAAARIDEAAFVSMQAYPDAVTYDLVGAASHVLEVPAAELLETFGEYWTRYTVSEGYGEMMAMFGSSLREFLGNLDRMHARIAMGFTDLRPPAFRVDDLPEESAMLLHYHSDREGLAPMVFGLLRGSATRFSENVEISQVGHRAELGHDVFRIQYLQS